LYNGGTNRLQGSGYVYSGASGSHDEYGHGNHVAGIIASNGGASSGKYPGIAPKVNLINVKVSNSQGQATTSNVVAGLQWINWNRQGLNIKVVNISLNSSVNESYNTNPIDAAVEVLWVNKIVVVVSAGNNGRNALYPPANDPFAIVVGAIDDRGTSSRSDDVRASYSGYGQTIDNFTKPDLVAPGSNLISLMVNNTNTLPVAHPGNIINGGSAQYFRMSGTSMAAPVVAGAVALLLQDEPTLTPDQVKYRLKATTYQLGDRTGTGAGALDIVAAVNGTTTQSDNTGLTISQQLTKDPNTGVGSTVSWNSVSWNSVSWNSNNWNSVSWNSVSWNSVSWNSNADTSAYWDN
jgi:serine protease AprX